MSFPLVSILIPTYNRPDDLAVALSKALGVDYPHLEVVVIDDCSTTPETERVLAEFPQVKALRLPRNVGLLGARNFGFAHCHGKYVVNLDDDSWFVDSHGVQAAVEILEAAEDVSVLALNISTHSGPMWPTSLSQFRVPYYTGCGNVYRRADVARVDPYVQEFQRQGEEIDRTLQLGGLGKCVVAAPNIVVYHNESPVNRNIRRHLTFEFANFVKRELMRAPGSILIPALVRSMAFGVVRARHIDWSLVRELLLSGRGNILFAWRSRRPVGLRSYLVWLKMSWQYAHRRRAIGRYATTWSYPNSL